MRGLWRLLLLCSLRLSKRRDFVEPRLRCFLGGSAGLRIELVDDIVKFKIGLAAGSRDQMPLGRLGEIDRRAATADQNARQAILRDTF